MTAEERYREALKEIRDQEWVENALDPQWAARIAKTVLEEPVEAESARARAAAYLKAIERDS